MEHHVFLDVRHAGFAVAFVAGPDKVDDIDCDLGFGVIGEQ